MRFGVRSKLIGAMFLSGFVPLGVVLAAGLIAARQAGHDPSRIIWPILLIVIVFTVLCFAAGLWIAQHELVRPVLTLERAARELEHGHFEHRLKEPGASGSGFRDDELGRLAGDFNRMAEHLERSVAELARANRLKQQFIDIASHELRTPITYILGAIELAQRQGGADEELLAKIAVKAQRLNRIVENMFKLLQHGSYEAVLRIADVDLPRLLRAAIAEAEPFTRRRRQTIEVDMPEHSLSLRADGEKLRDVVDNLLSNAIRFSPDGARIRVEVADQGPSIRIAVCDQGPGLSAPQLQHMFEPFAVQTEDPAHHRSGEFEYMSRGIGLGMSVVKRFVEMHGGTLLATAAPGGGTCVQVTLPKDQHTGAWRGESHIASNQLT